MQAKQWRNTATQGGRGSDAGADNNPLMAIFANDMIHAGHRTVRTQMEKHGKKWKEGRPSNEIEVGLQELFDWISATAESKPFEGLWDGVF